MLEDDRMIVRRIKDIQNVPITSERVHLVRCLTKSTAEALLKRCPKLKQVILTRTAKKNASKNAIDYLISKKVDIISDYKGQGRPVEFSLADLAKMRHMRESNFSYERIAEAVDMSRSTVIRALNDHTKFNRWSEDYNGGKGRVVWMVTRDADPYARELADRHYSRKTKGSKFFCGPGEKLVLITPDHRAVFVWRKNKIRWDGQHGVECALFRNEGAHRSSDLIREAVRLARKRWPNTRLFTYVWPSAIKSTDPGFCFKRAGWKVVGKNFGNGRRLTILEAPQG